MSASLVGSEMCIRDRETPVEGAWGAVVPQVEGARIIRARNVLSRRGPPPVSYTHLTLPTICSV
eukprot:4279563-Alexandrium_andersonii.AAC.1